MIEHRDMFENILSCFFSLLIDFAADPLSFEQIEKAIDDEFSMAVYAPANRMLKIWAFRKAENFLLVNCDLSSECATTLSLGFRRQTAASNVCRTRSVVGRLSGKDSAVQEPRAALRV